MNYSDALAAAAHIGPWGRNFPYVRDRYALVRLALHVAGGQRVSALKRSHVAGLLEKPLVRDVLSRLRGDTVDAETLLSAWPARHDDYSLTFGWWGSDGARGRWKRSWYQTTRRGWNLVVRLNFPNAHDRDLRKLLGDDQSFSGTTAHPIDTVRKTLAWARVDLDLDRREALIEEVQSDWVRDADEALEDTKLGFSFTHEDCPAGCRATPERLAVYRARVLAPHARVWEEATLAATIEALIHDFEVQTIWMHSYDLGRRLKGMGRYSRPPRSLYTRLPRRFRFEATDEVPSFVLADPDEDVQAILNNHDRRFWRLRFPREDVDHVRTYLRRPVPTRPKDRRDS